MSVPFDSPYYPYHKVIAGNTLRGAELIPEKLITYLLDLPDANGYQPVDDNSRPRVRLAKYLWHDGARPLEQPLPTPAEKLSMLFDPEHPDINTDEDKARHPKGYRIFAQRVIGQSSTEARSMIRLYPGRVVDESDFRTILGWQVEIWSNVNLAANTRTLAMDRIFAVEQCIREALSGVDIAGIGTIRFSRQGGSYNGSEILYTEASMVGRALYFSTAWSEGGGP